MVRLVFLPVFVVVLAFTVVGPVLGQGGRMPADSVASWTDKAWTHIVDRKGVEFSFIHYPEADNENSGVVIRLENGNPFEVRYGFTVIFRAPQADTSVVVEGTLRPGEMKTGDSSGLFWVPFKKRGYRVGEIGLRGIKIVRIENSGRSPDPGAS